MNITRFASRGLLVAKKHSPIVLSALGVVGVVGSAVMVGKATLKLEGAVSRMEEGLEEARDISETPDEEKRNLTKAYVKGSAQIVKLYIPAASLGVAAIGCLLGAQGIMHRRNVALVAAYKSLEHGFSEYRKRVISEFGEDKDIEFRRPSFVETEGEAEGDKTEEIPTRVNTNGISTYARFFDETSSSWQRNAEYNLMFVRTQQQNANDLLRARGHLFLNEVYDMLGIERSQAGQVVGWIYDGDGDSFVDFGLYNPTNEKAREFVNGQEYSILLDFNVDGIVYDKI